jgi:tetratricopeptide (TPR) repeat protein
VAFPVALARQNLRSTNALIPGNETGMDGYFDLGRYTRPVTTSNPQAQIWFDRGLNWIYGFNHEEAVACFRKAAALDPECAMAYWGIAFASGPFYNMPWEMFSTDEADEAVGVCHTAIRQATACSWKATPVEQALIGAVAAKFPRDHVVSAEECRAWDDAYANAMREVHASTPGDPDVIALTAEAMMSRTPWRLWNRRTGEPAEGADTLEAIRVLEDGIQTTEALGQPPHHGILHMYIHAIEMSDHPEMALQAADQLRGLVPDAGHLEHMPGHVYMLCGLYDRTIEVSAKAIAADRKYLAYAGALNFYTTARCHDLHLMMYAGMMSGRFQPATEAADEMIATLTPDLLRMKKPHMVVTLEGYHAKKMHVLVRFGRWHEIIETPLPEDQELYCVTTAMHRYARGVAHSALGNIAEAEAERELFRAACDRVPATHLYFNNYARDILAVGAEMLNGELEYRKGDFDAAFAHLRRAVELDDNLEYSEPWPWMHPPRHALGALLLEQGRAAEAEAVYRADLGLDNSIYRSCQHPDNVWALHGLTECLDRSGNAAEHALIRQRLDLALAATDVEIRASCCCRTEIEPPNCCSGA